MYQITFFVPKEQAEEVKEAMFAAGAGAMGEYSNCSWEIEGTGQFKPLSESTPFIGERNSLSRIPELRVEMMCLDECIEAALKALVDTHPYEVPAYFAVKFSTLEDFPEGVAEDRPGVPGGV